MKRTKPSDAVVTAHDLLCAIYELHHGHVPKTMKLLWATEPHLAHFIEGVADHITNESKIKAIENPAALRAELLDFIIAIVRAMERGYFRLWKDTIPPSSPLARLMGMSPENGVKDEPKK